tara:strand:+ start:713 stop:2092 length:1380 start_codon:yes stop_codon:yes gene_type:complete
LITNSRSPLNLSPSTLREQNTDIASTSFRELLTSLSKEQKSNQELLSSLSFVLRSFTNIQRYLELVPVVVSKFLCVECVLVIPFADNGKIRRDQLATNNFIGQDDLIREVLLFKQGMNNGFSFDKNKIKKLDNLIKKNINNSNMIISSIKSRGRERGRLYLFDFNKKTIFTETYNKYLQIITDITSVALENDLLFKKIKEHERVDRQISIGGEIQGQLLPDSCPTVEGIELAALCRPAFQVGGDYYDFIPTRPELDGRRLERGKWAFLIGDVMGKGVPAGLLMTMLRGMLRAEVLTGLPPDRILHDLNQLAINDLSQSNRFLTLFYSDYDPRSKKLRYSNAAHNPPLLWRSKSKKVLRLDSSGLLIGLQKDSEYISREIFLEPGDALLYYTDGVTEAQGYTGERFDEKRLIDVFNCFAKKDLSAQEILQKLFKKLDGFIGPENNLDDDASMVVLRVSKK